MLSQLLSGHFNLASILAQVLAVLVIIFLILPFHEWAHAQTAYLLGRHVGVPDHLGSFAELPDPESVWRICADFFGVLYHGQRQSGGVQSIADPAAGRLQDHVYLPAG